MIMELPKKFKLPFAEVFDGNLKIYLLQRFEDLMYELTYALKFPCCSKCNSDKSNLTHEEYLKVRSVSKKDRKKHVKQFTKYREKIMRKIGFKLPKKWVTFDKIDAIRYNKPEQDLKGKKYCRILEFYKKYQKLPRPIIVDKNNKLLDGYNIIVFANDFNIKKIPVIKLENVELVDEASKA
mgnify:CR=1 FL=1